MNIIDNNGKHLTKSHEVYFNKPQLLTQLIGANISVIVRRIVFDVCYFVFMPIVAFVCYCCF